MNGKTIKAEVSEAESKVESENGPVKCESEKKFLCHVCSKSFLHKHHLEIHLKVHDGSKDQKCNICSKLFRQRSHLIQHYKFHSGVKSYTCQYCSKSFTQNGDLKRHLKRHRSELPFHCTFCSDRFQDDSLRQAHEVECTSKQFKCKICEFVCTENSALKVHVQIHDRERRFECDICSQNFRLKHHLSAHRKRHTTNGNQERSFPCDLCTESFKSKQQLTIHRKIHKKKDEKKKHQCTICHKQFYLETNLVAHMKYHTCDRPFACEQCPKQFVQKGDLGRHMKMHERQKNKSANNECGKEAQIQEIYVDENDIKDEPMSDPDSDNDESSTFDPTYLNLEPEIEFGQESGDSIDMKDIKVERTESVDEWKENEVTFAEPCVEQKTQIAKTEQSKPSKCTLTENQSKLKSSSGQAAKSRKIKPEKVVSDQDRRFICDICNKSFRLKHHLKTHLATHTDQKDYVCEICSKQFKQGSHLMLHMRVHSGERNYPCTVCEKRFIHSSDMRRHLQTHREQFPFVCGCCMRRFANQDAKELHETKCTMELLKCEQCDYTTSINSRFRTHMKSHLAREFKCDLCSKTFIYKQNLENHLKIHSNERAFQCETCLKAFRLRVHLQRHIKRVHNKK